MNRRNNKKQQKSKPVKVAPTQVHVKLRNQSRLPNVVPPVWHCYNKYISQVIGYSPGAQVYGAFDYYINSPFSPDVSGTDTSHAIGCTELAQLYANHLTLSTRVSIEVCNEEDFEVIFTGAPSTLPLDASIGSASEALQLAELPWGKAVTLGRNSGMNRSTMKFNVNMSRLVGSRSLYMGDQNWIGLNGALPTNKLYMTFGLAALSGNNLSNGITFRLTMDFKMKWSNRKFDDITLLYKQTSGPKAYKDTRKVLDIPSSAPVVVKI